MPLAGDVLHQQHLAGTDHPLLPVARRDLDAAVEVDDVLPARRRMPIEVVVAAGLTKDDARRGHAPRQLAAGALLDPLDLDIAKMRLALGVDVEIVDAHSGSVPWWRDPHALCHDPNVMVPRRSARRAPSLPRFRRA